MGAQNSAHSHQWIGPSSRANRMDRKYARHLKPTITGKQLEALAQRDQLAFCGTDRLLAWAARHNAGAPISGPREKDGTP
jgi:hypothetical protein